MFSKTISLNPEGPNFNQITLGPLTVWFSYRTPIAFQVDGSPLVISENRWGPTTAKHLNRVNHDKSKRIPHDQVMAGLDAIASTIRFDTGDLLAASVAMAEV